LRAGSLVAYPDTRGKERQAFFRLLTGSPAAFWQHTGPLLRAVGRRIRTRLVVLLSSKHRGRKQKPQWLVSRGFSGQLSFNPAGLPAYPRMHRASLRSVQLAAPAIGSDDPEDYLADHRWRFLLEAVLAESPAEPHHCLERCTRWLEGHRDRSDAAWEPYSTCERVANLLVFLAMSPAEADRAPPSADVSRLLSESVDWILRHLEYYGPDATNNHIINNGRALVMAGAVSRENRVVEAGMRVLRASLPQLIMEGGFLRERSSHYHLVILNWVLDAWWFVAAFGGESGADASFLWSCSESMLAAAAMLCDQDHGLLATIGDVSPDSSPAQSVARVYRLYPERWASQRPPADCAQVRDGWFRISRGQEIILGNFPGGRYPSSFPTHGHSDLTGFVWLHDGREVLTDPGRYRYTQDALSLFQRSAAAHNVALVNGLAPLCESLTAGMWWPRPYADANLEITVEGGGVLLAHDGFRRATPVRHHTRRITLEDAGLLIVDSFDGHGEAVVTLCWLLGEDFDALDAHTLTVRGTGGRLTLSFDSEGRRGAMQPAVARLEERWISRVYGQKLPALGLTLRWRMQLPATISSRFALTPSARQ
jgi:heparinase II/III-like protein